MNKIELGNNTHYYQVFYKNNKNMYLRLKNGVITVTCNKRISKAYIEEYIRLNEAKILDRLNQQDNKVPLYNENSMEIFGKTYCCKCFYNQKTNKYNIDDDIIEIDFVKDYYDKVYIEKIYKDLLLTKIKSLYQELYLDISKHFCIDNIIFKTQLMKSRYGSCIPKKRIIKLNSILARFDEVYIKVILIHELIHLEEHNHQKGFYEYINSWIPNYRSYIKEINSLTRKYVI